MKQDLKLKDKKAGENYIQLAQANLNTSNYFDSTIQQGSTYSYRVYPFNGNRDLEAALFCC